MFKSKEIFIALLLCSGCITAPQEQDAGIFVPIDIKADNGIDYHNGLVKTSSLNIYTIWYGNWTTAQKSTINTFIQNLNQSPWLDISETYFDIVNGIATQATNTINIVGSSEDPNYSSGYIFNSRDDLTQITNKITDNYNATYMIFTSSDVSVADFCQTNCGWHGNNYIFVGNPYSCMGICSSQWGTSPNGDPAIDAMLSVIAHEISETITDPDSSTGWYDDAGAECADKCAWQYGETYHTNNLSLANMNLNGKDYLIQMDWLNLDKGHCALSVK